MPKGRGIRGKTVMKGTTHLIGGAVSGCIATAVILPLSAYPQIAPLVAAGGAVGALLPDIDHQQSIISTRGSVLMPLCSFLVSAFSEHRRFFHTPLFLVLFGGLCFFVLHDKEFIWILYGGSIAAGLLAGILSHLILDSFTPMGVMWAYPVSKRYFSLIPKFGRISERRILQVLLIAAFACVAIPKFIIWFLRSQGLI